MNYVAVVNLIFLIFGTLLSLYTFQFAFFAIVGVIHKKRFPHSDEKCRYGVLISAKDEENVIPRLINSIRSADYPQDKLNIIIIAHNCSDKTAEIARSLGAEVIEYNNPNARTLGSAYHYAFKHIDIKKYDGFFVLNADNIVDKKFFEKLNDAFVYLGKKETITSFRHTLNIKDGAMPAMYSYYFATSCTLGYAGRENFNVSSRITGCGFLLPTRMVENGWNYLGITEDIEYSGNTILAGNTIHYCDEAIFYDEQPRDVKTMWFQRLRWAKGQYIGCKTFFPKLLKALFSKEKKNKMSLFVNLVFHSFLPLTMFFSFVLQYALLCLSPLFGISLQETFLSWNYDLNWFENLFLNLNVGALFLMLRTLVFTFLSIYLMALMVLIGSRDKFKHQPKLPLILGFIFFPLFVVTQIPLDLSAMLVRDVKWRKIPHGMNK